MEKLGTMPELLFERVKRELERTIPDVVLGAFKLTEGIHARAPETVATALEPFVGWTVVVFALPITDEGQWIWHHHGERRSLMANYVLRQAFRDVQQSLPQHRLVDVAERTHEAASMSELGELAGLGTRGWNNLLLHPSYGGWLQLHAFLIDEEMPVSARVDESVCIRCNLCVEGCPVHAISVEEFFPHRCRMVVASPWKARSRAMAITDRTYLECRECLLVCPVGQQPISLFQWKDYR